jgi:hypothetical protein
VFIISSETKPAGIAIIMVHTNNHQSCGHFSRGVCYQGLASLTVACIPASSGTQLPFPNFTRWNYKILTEIPTTLDITTGSDYLAATSSFLQNTRVLRCLSDQPEHDVTSIFGRVGGKC